MFSQNNESYPRVSWSQFIKYLSCPSHINTMKYFNTAMTIFVWTYESLLWNLNLSKFYPLGAGINIKS